MGRPPTIPETEIQLAKLAKEGLKRATEAVRLATERGWMNIHVDALDKKTKPAKSNVVDRIEGAFKALEGQE